MKIPQIGEKVQISRESVMPDFEHPVVEVASYTFRPDELSALMFCYSWVLGNTVGRNGTHTYYGIVYWCGLTKQWVESFHADNKKEVQQRIDNAGIKGVLV